jgi:endonuclease-3
LKAKSTARSKPPKPATIAVYPPDPDRVEAIFRRLSTLAPDPRTELNFTDPFTLVVAVALSAQTTDKAVNKATERLFEAAPNPRAMLALGEEGVIPFISSIGLFRNKAKNVIALSRILLEQHGGQVPLERNALQALPGVGRKTASVVLNELGVEPAIAVDTHVFRVSHRLGLSNAPTPDKVEQQLFKVVPEWALTRAHHWLILHGRYTCVAQRPKCEACPVADLCPSRSLFLGAPQSPSTSRRTARPKAAPESGA